MTKITAMLLMAIMLAATGRSDIRAAEQKPDLDITVPALTGEDVRLADYVGDVIVFNFWASWCYPCRYEMPLLQKIHDQFAGQGLVVIAVAIDDAHAPAQAFQNEYGFTFPMLFDAHGLTKRALNVSGVPETYILDRAENLVPVKDPATGVASTVINNPTVWESEEIIAILAKLVEN